MRASRWVWSTLGRECEGRRQNRERHKLARISQPSQANLHLLILADGKRRVHASIERSVQHRNTHAGKHQQEWATATRPFWKPLSTATARTLNPRDRVSPLESKRAQPDLATLVRNDAQEGKANVEMVHVP